MHTLFIPRSLFAYLFVGYVYNDSDRQLIYFYKLFHALFSFNILKINLFILIYCLSEVARTKKDKENNVHFIANIQYVFIKIKF